MKKILLLLPLFFVFFPAAAQYVEWAFNLGMPVGNTITAVTATPAGDIYTAVNNKKGTILSQYPTGNLQLTRYDSTGAVVWNRIFPGKATVMALIADRQGNFIIGGGYMDTLVLDTTTLINPDPHRPDHFLAKMDPNGNFLWAKTAHTPQQTSFISNIATDNSNNIYVAGQATSLSGLFAKYDAAGNKLWVKQLPEVQTINNVQVDSTGAIFVTGTCRSSAVFDNVQVSMPAGASYVIFLARYNQQPTAQWVQVQPYHTFDISDGLLRHNNRLYWLHLRNNSGTSGRKLVLQKFNLQGNLLAETDSFPQYHSDAMANRFIRTGQQLAFSVARFDTARLVVLDTSLQQTQQFHFTSSGIKAQVLSSFKNKIVCGGSFAGTSVAIGSATVFNANLPGLGSNNDNYLSVFALNRTSGTVGLTSETRPEVRLFPNPARHIIYIEGIPVEQVRIFDLNGKLLRQQQGSNSISTEGLPQGLLMLEISSGSNAYRKRVVKF